MLKYFKYKTNATFKTLKGKWHLRIKHSETESVEDLAKHMSSHNCPFSESVIKAVIEDFSNCMVERLLEGKTIKIDNIGTFNIIAKSDGADSPESLSSENLKDFQLNVNGCGKLSKKALSESVKLQELPKYTKE